MEARFKRANVVYLNEDDGKQPRKKYKIIEYYLGDVPEGIDSPGIIEGKIREGKTPSIHNYLIEPLTDGASRIVDESQIEGLAE